MENENVTTPANREGARELYGIEDVYFATAAAEAAYFAGGVEDPVTGDFLEWRVTHKLNDEETVAANMHNQRLVNIIFGPRNYANFIGTQQSDAQGQSLVAGDSLGRFESFKR